MFARRSSASSSASLHDRGRTGSSGPRAPGARWTGFFRTRQLVSAALYRLGHGGNDAQKTMGIIARPGLACEQATRQAPADIARPARGSSSSCHAAIALGTLFGGWRIVKTMGMKITKLQAGRRVLRRDRRPPSRCSPPRYLGIPVSTTHTITGAIIGVGATQQLSAVRWGVATRIVWAWVLTIPCSALVAALCYWTSEPSSSCSRRPGQAD